MSKSQDVHKPAYKVLGKFWTLANVLSLARLVLVIPITYLIITDGSVAWILGLVFAALCTDWFDGTVARWSKTVSEWGKVLDPLADKIAAMCVVLALTISGALPVWFVVLIAVRDILIVWGSTLATRKLQRVLMSLWWGKVAVFMLALTVMGAILKADPPILNMSIWITSVLMVYSFFLYAFRYGRLMRSGEAYEEPEIDALSIDHVSPVAPADPEAANGVADVAADETSGDPESKKQNVNGKSHDLVYPLGSSL